MKYEVYGDGKLYATYDEATYGREARTFAERFVAIQKHKQKGAGLAPKPVTDSNTQAVASKMNWAIRHRI